MRVWDYLAADIDWILRTLLISRKCQAGVVLQAGGGAPLPDCLVIIVAQRTARPPSHRFVLNGFIATPPPVGAPLFCTQPSPVLGETNLFYLLLYLEVCPSEPMPYIYVVWDATRVSREQEILNIPCKINFESKKSPSK